MLYYAIIYYAIIRRWSRNPRPRPEKFSKLVSLIVGGLSCGYPLFKALRFDLLAKFW